MTPVADARLLLDEVGQDDQEFLEKVENWVLDCHRSVIESWINIGVHLSVMDREGLEHPIYRDLESSAVDILYPTN